MQNTDVFKNSPKCRENVFIDEQDIGRPTLLISAQFTTHHWLLKYFPRMSVIPVNKKIGLKLYFENLYDEEIKGHKGVDFWILHQEDNQVRPWRLNLPSLKNKGDCLSTPYPLSLSP